LFLILLPYKIDITNYIPIVLALNILLLPNVKIVTIFPIKEL